MPRNVFALLSSHFDVVLLAPGFSTGSHMSCNSLQLKLLFTVWTCVHVVIVVAVLHQNFDDFPWCFALIGFLLVRFSLFCSLFIILHDLFGLWVRRCSFHFGTNGFSQRFLFFVPLFQFFTLHFSRSLVILTSHLFRILTLPGLFSL